MDFKNIGFGRFWKLLLFLAGMGALAGVLGVIWLLLWLYKHLKLV